MCKPFPLKWPCNSKSAILCLWLPSVWSALYLGRLRSERKAKNWTQRTAVEEAKTRDGSVGRIQGNSRLLERGSGRREQRGREAPPPPSLLHTAACACCQVPAEAVHVTSLTALLENRTNVYVLKATNVCIERMEKAHDTYSPNSSCPWKGRKGPVNFGVTWPDGSPLPCAVGVYKG